MMLVRSIIWAMLALATTVAAQAATLQKLHVKEGTLYFADGTEALLWGVNFQPSLFWEYRRMARHGLHKPFDMAKYKAMIDEGFDEIQRMDCNLIRIHIATSDITDTEGKLIENQWLDSLDYVIASAEQREIYVSLSFLNNIGAMDGSFVSKNAMKKADWMVDPDFMAMADSYIRQLLNRKNQYSEGQLYKNSPALAIVEPINEPAYFNHQNINEFPQCNEVYRAWLTKFDKQDTKENFLAFRYENTKDYVNRMVKLFRQEEVTAPMAWSLEWPRAIEWTGEDVFCAAADSDAELISICFYPGQFESHNKRGEEMKEVGETNFLPYLQRTYDDRKYHGWLLEDRFKNKARVVYEFETFHNQTSYLYPAMAKLFRSLGIQAASMWTYILPGQAEYTAAPHNLNLKTTPNKAAAFMAAGQVMRSEPRFKQYETTSETDDHFQHASLSYQHGCSAFADDEILIYSETMPDEFSQHLLDGQTDFKRIVGRGDSPWASYGGTGLYFIETTGENRLQIQILPDADFVVPHFRPNKIGKIAVRLSTDQSHTFELKMPGLNDRSKVFQMTTGKREPVIRTPDGLRFEAKPGERYEIER
ncbi:Cellulase (glycosyl hydrolase family 5) [Neorhodopirellula lusitana]|uniref:Cellulase (Glycosyl hydrolase family 5) n=1 Tax=Neorhodopirellula lusitana TaxID=445327 RepID=A0ABY1QHY4_9BACT|nr:cellulase family glycosylhydrolase [Neorhodopirellula lusitana]SMP69680.1 Cellulase (glycosyl hydrolase family 5) [Neorhodopirellula lusitana]